MKFEFICGLAEMLLLRGTSVQFQFHLLRKLQLLLFISAQEFLLFFSFFEDGLPNTRHRKTLLLHVLLRQLILIQGGVVTGSEESSGVEDGLLDFCFISLLLLTSYSFLSISLSNTLIL